MSVLFPALFSAIEGRVMSRSLLRSRVRAAGRVLTAAALVGLVVSPLSAQGGRRGLEPRSAANGTTKGFGTYHALIFAVGDQKAGSGLPSLHFPIKETDSLRAVITREYTFEPRNVTMIVNPTREAILDSLEAIGARLGADDNLLVVYSGHGGYDEGGKEGYWLAADAVNARKSTWIPNETIKTWLRGLKARSVLLVTDACFSGSISRGNERGIELPADRARAISGALEFARKTSRQALTAGTARETVPQVSAFSNEIIASLKSRHAPVVMAQQLAADIRIQVAAAVHTTPTFSSVSGVESEQGDFVFVRRESAPETAQAVSEAPTVAPTGVRRGSGTTGTAGTATKPAATAAQTPAPTVAPEQRRVAEAPVARTAQTGRADKLGNIEFRPTPAATPGGTPAGSGSGAPAGTAAATPGTAKPAASIPAPSCDGGVSSGCVALGLKTEKGQDGVAQSNARAAELFRTACDVGDAAGCMNLGRMYDSRHDGISMDRGKARTYFTKGCDGGDGFACTAMGLAASSGDGGPVDDKKAFLLFGKGCDLGNSQGCGLLGIAYTLGKGVAQDEVRGRSWMNSGCNGDDAATCNLLARIYASGRGGVARDSVKAILLWKKACINHTNSIPEACANLGEGYLKGIGVLRDDVRAAQYLSVGCEGGIAQGCTLLASMYDAGSSVTAKSVPRAAELYKRGCDGGNQTACAWIKEHPQPAAPKK